MAEKMETPEAKAKALELLQEFTAAGMFGNDSVRFEAQLAIQKKILLAAEGENERLRVTLAARDAEVERLRGLLNTPETADFLRGVQIEAPHQRERWGSAHDAGKAPEDWFWLLGYLAGKALHAAKSGDTEKALHHTISSAAALANWHLALTGNNTAMRPGIDPVERGIAARTADQKALVTIDPKSREGKPPCGECHLQLGERCDICGALGLDYDEGRKG